MTEMAMYLARSPEWWERACNDPDIWPAIIEESVRLASPANGLWRVATRETELGGVTIPARAKVFVSFASATPDERRTPDPDTFNPDRPQVARHLGFGRGIHSCLGQNMARAEMLSALEILTSRVASISIPKDYVLQYGMNYVARGLLTLPLNLTYR
jgi:cytochrome P450